MLIVSLPQLIEDPLLKKHIPNIITLANLLVGCIAIVHAFHGLIIEACFFVLLAAVLDFLDGFTAKMLGAYSELGKQLDSLADMVSFGLTPAVIYYALLKNAVPEGTSQWLLLPAFSIAIFSAIRLAKFNIDESQSIDFRGLPTPACAMFTAGIPLLMDGQYGEYVSFIDNQWIYYLIVAFLSFMLVAPVRMFSLKFSHYKFKSNELRYALLLISLVLLILMGYTAITLIILVYIVLSFLFSLTRTS